MTVDITHGYEFVTSDTNEAIGSAGKDLINALGLAQGRSKHKLQFLVEAVVLSSFGGLFGIVIAIAGSYLLAGMLQVPFVLNPGIVVIAFIFSAAVGVIFGFFPARKSAGLNPVDALRHE